MSFVRTLLMVKAIVAIIIVTVSSFAFVLILSGHLGREVHNENIEFVLTKEHLVNVFTENGKISKEGLDEFLEMQHPKFALKLELGEDVYVSNPTLYEYGNFCKIKDSPVSCSREFRDFYLVDGKLKRAKINVVMKNA